MREVTVLRLVTGTDLSRDEEMHAVVLKETEGERSFYIFIGPSEAHAIHLGLMRATSPRPMTHDLLRSVIETMGGKVEHVVVSELTKGVFHAVIPIMVGQETLMIDARPSDAIALAARSRAPILCEEAVLVEASATDWPSDLSMSILWPDLEGRRGA